MNENVKLKDKIILVHYLGIKHINMSDIDEYIHEMSETLRFDDDSVFQFFVPVIDSSSSRVECINPVLVSDDKYAEALQKLDEAKERMEKAIKEFSGNNKTKGNG